MIRTILIDDHKLVSEGLKKLLENTSQFQVIKHFTQGELFLHDLPYLNADLLILDIEIAGEINGLETLRRVRIQNTDLKVVMLSMHEEAVFSKEAEMAGANVYLTKSIDCDELIQKLIEVTNGHFFFPKVIPHQPQDENSFLSRQEKKILSMIAGGKTSEEIASELGISGLTVKVHRRNMMKKLEVESAAELVAKCFSIGVL